MWPCTAREPLLLTCKKKSHFVAAVWAALMIQVFITLDDGVYEFTLGDGNKWICSRDKIQIKPECKIFAPANMRAAQEVEGYNNLISHYMTNKFTLRYTGGISDAGRQNRASAQKWESTSMAVTQ